MILMFIWRFALVFMFIPSCCFVAFTQMKTGLLNPCVGRRIRAQGLHSNFHKKGLGTANLHSNARLMPIYTRYSSLLSSTPSLSSSFSSPSSNQTTIAPLTSSPGLASVIDGKAIAAHIRLELKEEIAELKSKHSVTPGLAVVLVGARPDSASYVRAKLKACAEVGINVKSYNYEINVSGTDIFHRIDELNKDPSVHGILVQLPLPPHISEFDVINAIDPAKDVDGLHALNVHKLTYTKKHSISKGTLSSLGFHVPCTPQGCIEMLDRSGVSIAGARAVVIGRSNIVGIPLALLLMQRDATVTITHSLTQGLSDIVRSADIVVAAVGRPEMVKQSWIKPGAVVLDVGINSVQDTDSPKGYRLVGDVDYCGVKQVASAISPAPGGVGPMTIAMLLRNTFISAQRTIIKK